jgi:hypothetical protein
MQGVEGGSFFDFRFNLRTLLYGVTAASIFLALCPLIATQTGFIAFENAFLPFSLGLTAFAVWLATRNSPKYLGILIICHMTIAMFLLLGPIVSYHINGRAWYDYGMSPWNPPPFQFSDGTIGISDYDPKFTRPVVWPVIGPVMYVMSRLSMLLMIFPPTAPAVTIAAFVLASRLWPVLTKQQLLFVSTSWVISLVRALLSLVGLKGLGVDR